jgi:hypothetical protein
MEYQLSEKTLLFLNQTIAKGPDHCTPFSNPADRIFSIFLKLWSQNFHFGMSDLLGCADLISAIQNTQFSQADQAFLLSVAWVRDLQNVKFRIRSIMPLLKTNVL